MQVNWTSLWLLLINFGVDAVKIWSGYLITSGHPIAGAIAAAFAVTLTGMASIFAQNQPKPGACVPGAGGKEDSPGGPQ